MKKFLLTITLLLISFNASASNCPQLYPLGHEIAVPGTIELCNSFYVIRYNDTAKANIFSAEILQPSGHHTERVNDFHADVRTHSRVSPHLYSNTGFDKGHMVPAGDSTNPAEMDDTFLMTNMTPQAPLLNRLSWRMLEEDVRKMAAHTNHPIHVLTYAIYSTSPATVNGIPKPIGYFKAVYLDTGIRVYYANNVNHAPVTETTVAEFEKAIGYSIH
jgi:endonuclease G